MEKNTKRIILGAAIAFSIYAVATHEDRMESQQTVEAVVEEVTVAPQAEKQTEVVIVEPETEAKTEVEAEPGVDEKMLENRRFIIRLFEADSEVMASHMIRYEPTKAWADDFHIYASNIRMTIEHIKKLEDAEMTEAFAPIEESLNYFEDGLSTGEPILVEEGTAKFTEGQRRIATLEVQN